MRNTSSAGSPGAESPIGVFDSGIGGLSTLREIRRNLPGEDLLYVADSGYAPYGDKPADDVLGRATVMVEFLSGQGAKAAVIACNTATAIAVDALRSRFELPIVAIEPAVKPAVLRTRSGVIAVLATTRTLSSQRFRTLVRTHSGGVQVLLQPCPGLVEQVEAGDFSSAATRALIDRYVRPILEKGADTLVLGCTHYSFLIAAIQEAAGPGVTIVGAGEAVAKEVRRRLTDDGLQAPETRRGSERFWTTGPLDQVRPVIARLWGAAVDVQEVPS